MIIMEKKAFIIGLVVVVVITGIIALQNFSGQGQISPERPTDTSTEKASEGDFNVTESGERYRVNPDKLVQGCPGMDCIPSIDDPQFISAEEASSWLKDDDLVLAVEINNQTKAYPFKILTLHEIVNDELAGEPIAATYCPLCRSGFVFSRELGDRTLELGVSGKLYNANLVMYDRNTETYWSQIGGEAIVGPLVPQSLDIITSTITEWGKWTDAHPGTQVLSRETGIYDPSSYDRNPYSGYEDSSRVGFGTGSTDDRLHPKALVYGVSLDGESKAFPEEKIEKENAINDAVGGHPVLMVENQDTGGIEIFSRDINGGTLEFKVENGKLLDSNGNQWSFDGEALEGENKGSKLERIASHGIYWFAWSEFHPKTGVYEN